MREIAELWRDYYNMPDAFDPAADFDHLFEDGDTFSIGELPVRVMLSPFARIFRLAKDDQVGALVFGGVIG